jgi:FMN phosphatase YigB (HAD superfamily)
VSVEAVVFDVGEVLVDETRVWSLWADWLEVPRATFFAALGAVIARGEHHRRVFDRVRPDLAPFDLDAARAARRAAGFPDDRFLAEDLHRDVAPCFATLRARGYLLGVAGNQPLWAEEALRAAGVGADFIASSERWGVEKPSAEFFARVSSAAEKPARAIAYVGDRIDNDVRPAAAARMVAVWLRRGLWAVVQADTEPTSCARIVVKDLSALPDALTRL